MLIEIILSTFFYQIHFHARELRFIRTKKKGILINANRIEEK